MTDIVVYRCDGEWANFGQNGTDWFAYGHYEEGQWVGVIPERKVSTNQFCYDVDALRARGMDESWASTIRAANLLLLMPHAQGYNAKVPLPLHFQ